MASIKPKKDTRRERLRILCLDGGGVKGLASLIILKEVLAQVRRRLDVEDPDTEHSTPLPCEYFDLICGTSTGGLIAIMLGRLRYDIDVAITKYLSLSEIIFTSKSTDPKAKFDHAVLENAIKKVFAEAPDEAKASSQYKDPRFKGKGNICRTFVVATRPRGSGAPVLLRTYSTDNHDAFDAEIWEVARATSAAPSYFLPIKIQDVRYGDGGTGWNNPTFEAISEAREIWPHWPISCLISIGTGAEDPIRLAESAELSFPGLLGSTILGVAPKTSFRIAVARYCVECLTSCERIHRDVSANLEPWGLVGKYFRLNVPGGFSKISLDDWKMLEDIKTLALEYMGTPDMIRMKESISEILLSTSNSLDSRTSSMSGHSNQDNNVSAELGYQDSSSRKRNQKSSIPSKTSTGSPNTLSREVRSSRRLRDERSSSYYNAATSSIDGNSRQSQDQLRVMEREPLQKKFRHQNVTSNALLDLDRPHAYQDSRQPLLPSRLHADSSSNNSYDRGPEDVNNQGTNRNRAGYWSYYPESLSNSNLCSRTNPYSPHQEPEYIHDYNTNTNERALHGTHLGHFPSNDYLSRRRDRDSYRSPQEAIGGPDYRINSTLSHAGAAVIGALGALSISQVWKSSPSSSPPYPQANNIAKGGEETSSGHTRKLMTGVDAPQGPAIGSSNIKSSNIEGSNSDKSAKLPSTVNIMSKLEGPRQSTYFINGNGIDREVITTDICRYIGNDALVRPGTYKDQNTGQVTKGFYITAYRPPTSEQLRDLKNDSRKWEEERRKNPSAGLYCNSSIRLEIREGTPEVPPPPTMGGHQPAYGQTQPASTQSQPLHPYDTAWRGYPTGRDAGYSFSVTGQPISPGYGPPQLDPSSSYGPRESRNPPYEAAGLNYYDAEDDDMGDYDEPSAPATAPTQPRPRESQRERDSDRDHEPSRRSHRSHR